MALTARVRPAAGEPEGALVLFHGRGADENDLFPLLDALDPERRFVGATPRGPLSLPPGGAHWYALGGIGTPEATTFYASYGAAAEWLDGFLAEHGVVHDRLVLGGFSQGGVIVAAAAPGRDRTRHAGSGDRSRVGPAGARGARGRGRRGAVPRDADVPPARPGVRARGLGVDPAHHSAARMKAA
ncbi:MAG: phospholipase [Actinobacteria bacterium]|nr:MAG: phospholipase [Actinomycetota bacterium]